MADNVMVHGRQMLFDLACTPGVPGITQRSNLGMDLTVCLFRIFFMLLYVCVCVLLDAI